jgi:hypothetical protein
MNIYCVKGVAAYHEFACAMRAVCATVPGGMWTDYSHAMRMRHILICGLPRSTIFSHIISYMARFSKKKLLNQNVCFDFLYNFGLKHFLLYKRRSEI